MLQWLFGDRLTAEDTPAGNSRGRGDRHGRFRRLGVEPLEERTLLSMVTPSTAGQTLGLLYTDPAKSFEGYTLFAPSTSKTTYLIDSQGRVVHTWQSNYTPGQSAYLLEDGSLLRTAAPQPGQVANWAPGLGGRIERYSWDGALIWSYDLLNTQFAAHHDIEPLPNGNILLLVWEYKSADEATAAGRDPALLAQNKLIPDAVFEVQPTGSSGGNIVWEWHVWDHLIQDRFPDKANYGNVGQHPELVDINYVPTGEGAGGVPADWTHMNGIDYNAALDQILLSVREFSEVWIIDHSTTTAEAAGHTGGNSGKGGDLLYRWGNPRTYRAGTAADQKLFYQHNAEWTDAGTILLFNNGWARPDGNYSSADEFQPPVDGQGNYTREGAAFGPSQLVWTYRSPTPSDFFAPIISGTQRLPNGNTLVTEGTSGTIFEVTPAGEVVWYYVSPITGAGPLTQGAPVPSRDIPGIPEVYQNLVFRSYRYAPDYPGLVGRDLTPAGFLEFEPPHPVGVFDPATAHFYLSNNHGSQPGGIDNFGFNVNLSGWSALVGDWDGDGIETIGVFNPYATWFYLKGSNNGDPADVLQFGFGGNLAGWFPLVGDWDGDGVDTIGVWNPRTNTFYLKNSNNSNPADVTVFGFGNDLRGWFPVTGDWNGDGVDTIGVWDPQTNTFYLKDSNNTDLGDLNVFSFGSDVRGWFPIAGDWNGDGLDTIGVFDPYSTHFYFKNSNNADPGDVIHFGYGGNVAGWQPVVGTWEATGGGAALRVGRPGPASSALAAPSAEQLAQAVDAALDRWVAAGIAEAQLNGLRKTAVVLADLPGDLLGQAEPGRVLLDRDAAGWGWFVDPTPGLDEEFFASAGRTAAQARPSSAAEGRVDLLSVVSHEFGHLLGLPDLEESLDALMSGVLHPGLRRTPAAAA